MYLISKSLNIRIIAYEVAWGEINIETNLDVYNSDSVYVARKNTI
tara:strand:+ start:515 stop:649 length:135 start_codon:yes stop_codon:yes gene_type:complete